MWLGRDPAIIRDPACIAYLIYTAPASKQDPALIWTRLINGHIRYISVRLTSLCQRIACYLPQARCLCCENVAIVFKTSIELILWEKQRWEA